MPKSDDKGEPVKIVRIGGREVEVPIIFVLPEEAGEKEIERYERPKVNIKKEDKAAESEEEPLEELTDGKLEEIEKPPFAVPKKKMLNYSDEEIVEEDGKTTTRKKKKPELLKGEEEEENTPYFDLLSDTPKKEKKRPKVLYSDLLSEEKSLWKSWLENKGLGALGEGKLNRKTGKKMKLRRRQPTLDDFPDNDGDKKDET